MKSKYIISDFIDQEILNDLNEVKEHIDSLVVLNDKLKNKESFISVDDLFFENGTEKKSLLDRMNLIQIFLLAGYVQAVLFGIAYVILKLFGAF